MNIDGVIIAIPKMSSPERKTVREKAELWSKDGTSEQKAAARKVLDALDHHHAEESQALSQHVLGLPKAQRIVEAFQIMPITEPERKIIQALLDNPGATSAALSNAAGWKKMGWHMHFGKMCSKRGAYLWPAPFEERRNADFYSGILADYSEEIHGFTMKPEAVEAFAALGLKGRAVP